MGLNLIRLHGPSVTQTRDCKDTRLMPFETMAPPTRRIAVIGGGISGMAAAHLLAPSARIVLIEAEPRLGGHARTVLAGKRGDQPVDTGFIVYNRVNYPNLIKLFADLDVPVVKSNMSFGASIDGGRIEYGLASLNAVFAQRSNLVNPAFLGMLRDVLRFNRLGAALADDPSLSIGQFLEKLGTGRWFRDYYILPISGAIWSTPAQGILDYPAQAMIRFFQNHALMSVTGQHQWYTVKGGSIQYVTRLQAALTAAGVDIRTGAAVEGVRRVEGGVQVRCHGGEWEGFDEVIFATHSDDALRLLADASAQESARLSAARYQSNEAVLHCDTALMPKRRATWSSWVYVQRPGAPSDRIDLTYWMNSLQPIPQDDPLFVTLNSNAPIDPAKVYDTVTFRHPVYDLPAQAAKAEIAASNGARRTWFCGAWMRNGFHEDGFASAVDVAEALKSRAGEPA